MSRRGHPRRDDRARRRKPEGAPGDVLADLVAVARPSTVADRPRMRLQRRLAVGADVFEVVVRRPCCRCAPARSCSSAAIDSSGLSPCSTAFPVDQAQRRRDERFQVRSRRASDSALRTRARVRRRRWSPVRCGPCAVAPHAVGSAGALGCARSLAVAGRSALRVQRRVRARAAWRHAASCGMRRCTSVASARAVGRVAASWPAGDVAAVARWPVCAAGWPPRLMPSQADSRTR